MFLPSELRRVVGERLHAPPVLVVPGRPRPPPGATWLGLAAFAIAGVVIALVVLVHLRTGRAIAALVLGLVGTILWALAALSTFPELTRNEMLLSFWPTDALLPWIGKRYVSARVIVLALVIVAHLGLLVQPIAPSLLALLPLGAIAWTERRA
jgi:hypothetical protein